MGLNNKINEGIKKYKLSFVFLMFFILELVLVGLLFSFFTLPINGSSGTNVTVQTLLTVGNTYPEVLTVVIGNLSNYTAGINQNVTLNPGSNKVIYCNGIARDWNNNSDIKNITAVFFQNGTLSTASDDNNTHYSNSTCAINSNVYNPNFGDDSTGNFTVNYSCSFNVQYYTNPGAWNCSVFAFDNLNWNGTNSSLNYVNQLLAITLPSSIDYGTVNSTYVSEEKIINVSNAGNVIINLSLVGYAITINDSLAMNCTKGNVRNISIMYEKYNLTTTNPVVSGLSDFETKYVNLTNSSIVRKFDLSPRTDDSYDDAINATYWRIYVPRGVAGTCSGNILFGAVQGTGN